MSQFDSRQNVVIVGGGPTGVQVFNTLETKLDASKYNLVLITARPYFTHLIATIRMVVTSEGQLENSILMPFGSRFNEGNKKLIIAKVTSVVDNEKEHYVTLDNGERISFLTLVLSPGSKWEGPLAFADNKEETLEQVTEWRGKFEKAQDIVLVGAGAVGIEFAGEIKDQWPDKNVTIVHGQSAPMNAVYPLRWREDISRRLHKRGVNLIVDDYVDTFEPKDGQITTRKGKSITADLVVATRGTRPNTKFIESLGSDVLTPAGLVKVSPTLQVPNHPNIFAGGDVIDWDEQKQAGKAATHAGVIAQNILLLLDKTKPLTIYKGSYELIVVTIGKAGGAGYLSALWGITLGDWLCALLKSKYLLIDMTKKSLRLP
ncbi:hypothetical protein B0H34DRAFT_660708 [Crassisporium funariophilum]|nr:hypothetical protein B0H34DRAFT_660708 [Crassisporium funariophilum]